MWMMAEDEHGSGGLRFFWWGDEGADERADEQDREGADGAFGDPTLDTAAEELARELGDLVASSCGWRSLPAGGAGENGIVELVAQVAGHLGLLHLILKTPGVAKDAWGHISRFFERAKKSQVQVDASFDLAIARCLAKVQEDWPGAYTNPFAVKVVEDGAHAAMFADRPMGVHVVVIPDLMHKKTHIFAIDSSLTILGHMMLDGLTTDAEDAGP